MLTSDRLRDLAVKYLSGGVSPAEHWAQSQAKLKFARRELIDAAAAKCEWCESKPRPTSYLQLDHYLPKTRFPRAMYEWSNLVVSCQVCNTNKGPYWDPRVRLVSPLRGEPSRHIDFISSSIVSLTDRGDRSISRLDLGRRELDTERAKSCQLVGAALGVLKSGALTSDLRQTLEEFVGSALSDSAPHAGCVRARFKVDGPKRASLTYDECVDRAVACLLEG